MLGELVQSCRDLEQILCSVRTAGCCNYRSSNIAERFARHSPSRVYRARSAIAASASRARTSASKIRCLKILSIQLKNQAKARILETVINPVSGGVLGDVKTPIIHGLSTSPAVTLMTSDCAVPYGGGAARCRSLKSAMVEAGFETTAESAGLWAKSTRSSQLQLVFLALPAEIMGQLKG